MFSPFVMATTFGRLLADIQMELLQEQVLDMPKAVPEWRWT